MSSGGHNKKPESLKLLRGTVRPGRKKQSPNPGSGIQQTPPSWLSPYAKAFWRRYVRKLNKLGVLAEADQPAFEELCLLYARIRECHETLKEEGLLVPGRGAPQVKHPLISVLNAAENQFRLLGAEFGLTPSSRGRLDIPAPSEEDSKWDKLING